jgi:putative transposase-like DNA-binding protein
MTMFPKVPIRRDQVEPEEPVASEDRIGARQYGLLPPLDWDDECEAEIDRQRHFWNDLVEIERSHRELLRKERSKDPEIADLEAQLAAISTRIDDTLVARNRLRADSRSKENNELDEPLKQLAAERRALYEELKPLHRRWARENPSVLDRLEKERRAKVTLARHASELWHGNYRPIMESFEVARQRALKDGTELRFHRRDGSARITNTPSLQDASGSRNWVTPAELFAARLYQTQIDPVPDDAFSHPSRGYRRRAARTELRVTIFTANRKPRLVRFPMIYHQAIPANGRIKRITVTRKIVGLKPRWRATVTFEEPSPSTTMSHAACGIDLGWRRIAHGLRVAVMFGSDARRQELVLPHSWIERMNHVERLRAEIDTALNDILPRMRHVAKKEVPEPLLELFKRLRQAPRVGSGLLAAIEREWVRSSPKWNVDDLNALRAWARLSLTRRKEMDNLRDKLIAQRTDMFRNFAAVVAQRYGRIGLKDFDVSRIAAGDELPKAARHYRQLAASAALRLQITQTARREGRQIVAIGGPTTIRCADCGHLNSPVNRSALNWYCAGCGAIWDQDDNASRNILTAAFAASPEAKKPRTTRWKKIKAAAQAKQKSDESVELEGKNPSTDQRH